ncbi:MAG: EVE domain-containing protein [Pirellula sp.]|jgi:predicted RNA-binding protein with PUA-like domain|nr:EVE domain-containing protein [Pirellula sp.]
MKYWLMKTEPDVFSIDDLIQAPNQTTHWDGVRNYQARNYMRDEMAIGDGVLIYHSNAEPPAVVGTATIAKTAYPDWTAWDESDPHYDPKTDPQNPRWFMVDVRFESKLTRPVPLAELRTVAALEGMVLLQKGSRLSVQPVTKKQFTAIIKLASK